MNSYDLFHMRGDGKNIMKQLEFSITEKDLVRAVEQVDATMLSNNKRRRFTTLQGQGSFIDLARASAVPLYGCLNFQRYHNKANKQQSGPVKIA